jgi:hypothetical protein
MSFLEVLLKWGQIGLTVFFFISDKKSGRELKYKIYSA